MKRWASFAVAALTVIACQDASGPATPALRSVPAPVFLRSGGVPDRYIVVLNDAIQSNANFQQEMVGNDDGEVSHSYRHALRGFAARLSPAAIARLAQDPRVKYIEQDQVVSAIAEQTGATWGLDRVDQRDLLLSGTYEYNADGTGVTAYIIDTGIRLDHGEFGGRAKSGFDAVDGGSADDCNGHGTHVAGTVGGSTYGIAKNVSLVAVRVLGCTGSGTTSGVIAGIDWVTADHAALAPAVANMSLGGGASTALDNAVINSINDGVTYGVAAGNSNANACLSSPARAGPALTVASTTSTDARSSFSSFGTCVDIFAPGSSITSAWYTSATATNTISGTSMATPHVVGAAALYLQTNPAAKPADVESALEGSATAGKVTNPGTGSPNLLLYTAFIIAGPLPPAPDAPLNLTATTMDHQRIDLAWTDNSTNESGFEVQRSQGGGAFTVIANLGANVTSFSNTGLAASTTYAYRVFAKNAGVSSAPSNTATATTSAAPSPAQVIINEILANEPGSTTSAEFVELVNVGGTDASIGGWTIYDNSSRRHTFAAGTILQAGKAIVVFAGASAIPSGINAVAASTGSLSLSNGNDRVRVRNSSGTTINSFSYGSSLAGTDGVSMNRNPDATATGTFVLHTTLISTRQSSAGKRYNGGDF